VLRLARRDDVERIVALLADDDIARARENFAASRARYDAAFEAIASDANNDLYVWDEGGQVIGCLQLTFIPGLSYQGAWLAKVEGVRVDRVWRGRGVGEAMIAQALARCRQRGCKQLQLTTDKRRVDAQRFYRRLGFVASHEGMTIAL
jgi:GNAT superfamily N-acetyltransferase